MGIFDFLKKKAVKQESNQNILSGDGLINYVKSNLENPTEENVLKALDRIAKPADDLEHLTKEGDLPWGWHNQNKDFIEKINKEYSYFLNNWLNSRYSEPKKHYEVLKSFVLYLDNIEKLCKKKGECFVFWFSEVLTSPTYLQERKEELKELEENFDNLQTQYEERQIELFNLDAKIIKRLKENQGVLQSEFIKTFNPLVQNEVKDKLYHWDKDGKVQRTKSGRSYILYYMG